MADYLYGRQWAQQEVLRTITLGFSPFIPFSQQYVMKMKTENENVEMKPDPPMMSQKEDAPWAARKKDYFKQPEQSPREIIDKAPRTDVKEISKKLQRIFDVDTGANPAARSYEESVVGEILSSVGIEEIDRILNELGTPIQKGIESSDLFKGGFVGGQGFDRQMTDSMRTVLSSAFDGRDMSGVVALEETETKNKKEIQANLEGKTGQEAIDQVIKNADDVYGAVNKKLKGIKVDNFKQLEIELRKEIIDPYYATNAYAKQMVMRSIDMISKGFSGNEYMYTAPVGDTGMAASVFLKTIIENNSPQIKYDVQIKKTGGHGRLIELLGLGLTNINSAAGIGFSKNMAAMDMVAMNQSVLTADRVGYIGMMQEVKLATMMDMGTDITMSKNKGRGVTGLSSKAMADSLTKQMDDALKDKTVQNKFAKIYTEIIAKANKASDLWKKNVSPPIDYMGAKGVWKMSGPNWRDKTGEDFSVSPFLMIRRKGVASFKPKNEAKFL